MVKNDEFLARSLRALSVVAVFAGHAIASSTVPPAFVDWHYIMPDGWRTVPRGLNGDQCEHLPPYQYDPEGYSPMNQPGGGHGGPSYAPGSWRAWYAVCLAQQQDDAGAPIAILIRNRNCPFPYSANGHGVEPDSVRHALDALPKLDYLIMDLELIGGASPAMVELNALDIVRQVRTHPNPRIADAYIGNYIDAPNRFDQAWIWPSQRDRTESFTPSGATWDRYSLYHNLFNLAMPSAYPYESYSRHSDTAVQGDDATPNDRAAIFWAPLERVSAAARELPLGHRLVPWISNYVDSEGDPYYYHAPPPSQEDLTALVQHIRLRGAASFSVWTPDTTQTDHPTIGYESFRDLAMSAWRDLDPFFETAETAELLNLETDKPSGVQWSAIRTGDEVTVLVSNLHGSEPAGVELPLIGGLPARTADVAPGEHRILSYTCNPAVRDYNSDSTVNDDDFIAYVHGYLAGDTGGPNLVGGDGGNWRDVNSDGLLDVSDVYLVAQAYWDGAFADFSGGRPDSDDDSDGISPD